MNVKKLRYCVYRFSDIIVTFLSALCTYLLFRYGLETPILDENIALTTIGVTLAAFLYTAQSILISMNPENKFLVLAKKENYVRDFFRYSKRAEIALLLTTIPLFFVGKHVLLDGLMLMVFIYGFIYVLWTLWLFSNLTKLYTLQS